ncbi:hypothetical protein, partial [Streptomyces tremellae]|uniref:hypothetical protein n=1 Tax=Streptomyces tremellae TaxID=1124239 RepID=UPI0031E94CCD
IQGNARYEVYRQAVVDMARVVLQQARASAGFGSRDVSDVLDSYFMDLASIAATNDDRLLGVPGRGGSTQVRQDIATVYNAYRQLMHDDPALSDLRPHLPPLKTEADVAADYRLLAGRVAAGLLGGASVSKEMLPPPQRPATETAHQGGTEATSEAVADQAGGSSRSGVPHGGVNPRSRVAREVSDFGRRLNRALAGYHSRRDPQALRNDLHGYVRQLLEDVGPLGRAEAV